jgi:hypothetical protein
MDPSQDKLRKGDPNIKLVEVYTAHGETEAQMIRSMLEGSGIDSMLRGETTRITHGFTVDGLAEVKIIVREEDEERAKEVLDDFKGKKG